MTALDLAELERLARAAREVTPEVVLSLVALLRETTAQLALRDARVRELETERDALREALEWIAHPPYDGNHGDAVVRELCGRARAALEKVRR